MKIKASYNEEIHTADYAQEKKNKNKRKKSINSRHVTAIKSTHAGWGHSCMITWSFPNFPKSITNDGL